MQKLLLIALTGVFLIPVPSRAEPDHSWEPSRSESAVHSVIPRDRVRVNITKPQAKLRLPKQQRPVVLLSLNDDEPDYYTEVTEFQVGYRRPELINCVGQVADLTDEIRLRLALARLRALERYYEKWG